MLMVFSTFLLIEGLGLFLTRNFEPFNLIGVILSLTFFSIGIWMIDWEAKLYYKSLKRRIKNEFA